MDINTGDRRQWRVPRSAAFTLAFANKIALELGDRTQDGEHQVGH